MNRTEMAQKVALFIAIHIPYPPHSEFHARVADLIEIGLATRGRAQRGIRVLAVTGSGKTTAAEALVRLIEAKYPPRKDVFVPVIHISLERAATAKKLMMSILDEFEDEYSPSGNEQTLKKRVKACFERLGTLLLIIDEVQHLNFQNSKYNDVADSLKRLLDDGVVPIAFLGTEDAKVIFDRNLQLCGRMVPPCDFHDLDPRRSEDRQLLAGYVASLANAMIQAGIIAEAGGLTAPGAVGAFHVVSKGVIGRVSRTIEAAMKIAIQRGSDVIEVEDLVTAVDSWAIPLGFATENPFRLILQ